jgi:hypothetical protein
MSATRREREQHAERDRAFDGPHRPYWRRMHRSWFFWVAAAAMLAAMVIYVTSINLAFRPRARSQPPLPAGNAP